MKKVFFASIFTLISAISFSQNDEFVRLPAAPYEVIGARAIGMANAVASVPDGAASIHFNPGNLTELGNADMDFVYETGTELTDRNIALTVANPKAYLDKGQAFGFRLLTQPIIDEQGAEIKSKLTEIFFSYGGRANIGGISAGLTMKYISQNIDGEGTEKRLTMDFGMRTEVSSFFSLGLTGKNLFSINGDVLEQFPRTVIGGASFNVSEYIVLSTDAAWVDDNRDEPLQYRYGLKLRLTDAFAIRGGYFEDIAREEEYFTAGITLKSASGGAGSYAINYSYIENREDGDKSSNIFGLSLGW
jgi:hypothetical protein